MVLIMKAAENLRRFHFGTQKILEAWFL